MEPTLTDRWAGDPPNWKDGEAAVKKGKRNFMPNSRNCILHYCARKYLCRGGQTYYITDMSKGAMQVSKANSERKKRWEEWFPLLEKELELVAKKDAIVFAISKKVESFLTKKQVQGRFNYRLKYLLHPGNNAAHARKKCIAKRKTDFAKFKQTVTEKNLIEFASTILSKEGTEWAMKSKKCIENKKLSDSEKMLIFCYKITFEGCR